MENEGEEEGVVIYDSPSPSSSFSSCCLTASVSAYCILYPLQSLVVVDLLLAISIPDHRLVDTH